MSGTWASGLRTGDALTVDVLSKSAGLIADSTLGASSATFDFTGLISNYANLRIVLYARGTAAATSDEVFLRFNNDSGANYDYQLGTLTGNAGAWASAESIAAVAVFVGAIPAASAPADSYGMKVIEVPHYAGSSDHKTVCGYGSAKFNTTTGNFQNQILAGWWRSTAAINRVTVDLLSGNFDAGSRCSIYAFGD